MPQHSVTPNAVRLALLFAFALSLGAAASSAGDDRIHWKRVDGQLKLDGNTPLAWNIYQPEKSQKKSHFVLVLLGRRYLAVDFKAKQVYQVLPTDLKPEDDGFESGDLFIKDRLIPTDAWTVRDVGPAQQIRVTLNDYGRKMEILLRHPPDLRAFY